DDIRRNAGRFKAEETARAAAAGLDDIDDQQNAVTAAQCLERFEPAGTCHVKAAFTLDGFDNDGGGGVDPAGRITEHFVEQANRIQPTAHVAVEGNAGHAAECHAAAATVVAIAGGGRGTQRYTVKAVGEGDDVLSAGHFAGQLHGGFHCIRAGGARELHAVVHAARLKDALLEGFHETGLGASVHVQAVCDAVAGDIVEQRFFAYRVVVPVIQRSGSRQEVDIAFAFSVVQGRAFGTVEHARE